MQLKIFCAWWGLDHLGLEGMIKKIKEKGYDGIECFIPSEEEERKELQYLLSKYKLDIIAHQFQAEGKTFEEFADSFRNHLISASKFNPIKINSHTGKDFWSIEHNGKLIDIAEDVERDFGIPIVHETHRGRFLYSASVSKIYMEKYVKLRINADFSHWVCVSESMLQDQNKTIELAIQRADHIHARVGYEQGAQVPDPRVLDWQGHLDVFMFWWQSIVDRQNNEGKEYVTITPEFGPPPYTFIDPYTKKPINDFFEINCWMKDYLRKNIKV